MSAEPLAAVGAMLYSSDLAEIGRVTRSTKSSAWVGGQRFVYALPEAIGSTAW